MPESEHTRLTAIELQRIAPLSEAARLAGVSKDTLQRHHADKILKLSPRRLGMRVRDALLHSSPNTHVMQGAKAGSTSHRRNE
jgi:hypothetical protein